MKTHARENNFTRNITLILVTLFLAGCSGPPSERAGRQILEKRIHEAQDESKGLIKLVSFRKTNATVHGSDYVMEYEVEIEFTDNVTVYKDMMPFWASRGSPKELLDKRLIVFSSPLIEKRKGEKRTCTGALRFEKTERGWRGEDGNVY